VELRQLRYFAAVAQHRHFTRASEELRIAQPALSQQLRRLEAELGMELLTRTSRRVALTQAGEIVLARARRILADADAIEYELAELRGLARARVTVGGMLPLGHIDLPALLAEFVADYPGIDIHLREGTAPEMLAYLERDEIEVAFAAVHPHEVGADLECLPLFDEELVIICAPDDLLTTHDEGVSLTLLAGEPLILPRPGPALRTTIDRALEAAHVRPRIAFESNDLTIHRELAARGLGISILPRSFLDRPGPEVAVLSSQPEILTRPVSLVWRPARRQSPAAEAFLDFTRNRVRELVGAQAS
jgi:LysR family transcriptional regulator, transcription activator of glutamate synthase operon